MSALLTEEFDFSIRALEYLEDPERDIDGGLFLDALEKEKYVRIKNEEGSNRVHVAIFDEKRDKFFILIVDELDGTVVHIFSKGKEFFEGIRDFVLVLAKAKMLGGEPFKSSVYVTCITEDEKVVNLGQFRRILIDPEEYLEENDRIHGRILRKLRNKGINLDTIIKFKIRLNFNSKTIPFDFDERVAERNIRKGDAIMAERASAPAAT